LNKIARYKYSQGVGGGLWGKRHVPQRRRRPKEASGENLRGTGLKGNPLRVKNRIQMRGNLQKGQLWTQVLRGRGGDALTRHTIEEDESTKKLQENTEKK